MSKNFGICLFIALVWFSVADTALATSLPQYSTVLCQSSFIYTDGNDNQTVFMLYPSAELEGAEGYSWFYSPIAWQSPFTINSIDYIDLELYCDMQYVPVLYSTGGGGGSTTSSTIILMGTSNMNATTTCVANATSAVCNTQGLDYTLLLGIGLVIMLMSTALVIPLLMKK